MKADLESIKLKKETERLERKRKLEAEKAEKERIKKEKKVYFLSEYTDHMV